MRKYFIQKKMNSGRLYKLFKNRFSPKIYDNFFTHNDRISLTRSILFLENFIQKDHYDYYPNDRINKVELDNNESIIGYSSSYDRKPGYYFLFSKSHQPIFEDGVKIREYIAFIGEQGTSTIDAYYGKYKDEKINDFRGKKTIADNKNLWKKLDIKNSTLLKKISLQISLINLSSYLIKLERTNELSFYLQEIEKVKTQYIGIKDCVLEYYSFEQKKVIEERKEMIILSEESQLKMIRDENEKLIEQLSTIPKHFSYYKSDNDLERFLESSEILFQISSNSSEFLLKISNYYKDYLPTLIKSIELSESYEEKERRELRRKIKNILNELNEWSKKEIQLFHSKEIIDVDTELNRILLEINKKRSL